MSSATLFARTVARTTTTLGRAFGRPTTTVIISSSRVGVVRMSSSYFTPAHEYIKVDGKVGTIGITDFAQSALGDIVFVELPEVGEEYGKGESFGSVESVKAASDVYAPVSGTVVETNETLNDEPELVNKDAEGNAWFIKIDMSDESDLEGLMDAKAYKEHCDKESA